MKNWQSSIFNASASSTDRDSSHNQVVAFGLANSVYMWECRYLHSSDRLRLGAVSYRSHFQGKWCHILERVRSLLNRCHTLRHYSQDYILRCLLAQIGILGISHKSIIEFRFFGNAHCITEVISKLVFVLLSCCPIKLILTYWLLQYPSSKIWSLSCFILRFKSFKLLKTL